VAERRRLDRQWVRDYQVDLGGGTLAQLGQQHDLALSG
jgi:hypothetical protein